MLPSNSSHTKVMSSEKNSSHSVDQRNTECGRFFHMGFKQSPWQSPLLFSTECVNQKTNKYNLFIRKRLIEGLHLLLYLRIDILYYNIRTHVCKCHYICIGLVPGPPTHWPHLQAAYWHGHRWAIVCRGFSEREEEGGCAAMCPQCMQDPRCTGHAQEPHTRWPLSQVVSWL